MAREIHWMLRQPGRRFHNKTNITVRELVKVEGTTYPGGQYRPTTYWTIHWKKVQGRGKDEGVTSWRNWLAWVKGEWQEPRPA